jgi:hypothetical protein
MSSLSLDPDYADPSYSKVDEEPDKIEAEIDRERDNKIKAL